jgi:ankyrin repeat protein
MKHDHITDEEDEVEEIVEVISELGDLRGIQDGEWPNIDQFESPRLLSCLLQAGLNPEILDQDGNSLLSQCVVHPDCIRLLIERGVAVDRRSGRDNMTALMRATYKGDQECVQRLLDAGADPPLEFSNFATAMLNLDDRMEAFIEAAREDWKGNKQ